MKELILEADKCGKYTEMQKPLITVQHFKALQAWQKSNSTSGIAARARHLETDTSINNHNDDKKEPSG